MFLKTSMFIAGLATLGLMSGCYDSPEERTQHFVDNVSQKLELSETQKTHLADLSKEVLVARTKLREDREVLHQELNEMLTADRLDETRLNALLTQKLTAVQTLAPALITKAAEFHASLNAEQKLQIAEHVREHKGHRRRWH